jgi:tol-pal system protein YbgF
MKFSHVFLLICAASLATFSVSAQDDRPYSSAASSTYNETRLTAQEEELRALNGRIEQIEFSIHRLEQTLQRMQSDTDARLTRLESATAAPLPAVQPVAQPSTSQPQTSAPVPADTNGTLGALKMQNGKVTGGINKPQSPPLPVVPPDYGLTPQEQYERALNFLRETSYPEAEQAFKSFIDKNPQDKLLDNAKYWYGETLYVRDRFDEAAVAFADAYQQNPRGTKAPDSLLKLGLSLGALKKTQDACVTLNELKSKYPNASSAIKSRAAEERAKMKCPAR